MDLKLWLYTVNVFYCDFLPLRGLFRCGHKAIAAI